MKQDLYTQRLCTQTFFVLHFKFQLENEMQVSEFYFSVLTDIKTCKMRQF